MNQLKNTLAAQSHDIIIIFIETDKVHGTSERKFNMMGMMLQKNCDHVDR